MARSTYPCFVNAIPKGGTHLGHKLLVLLGYHRLRGHVHGALEHGALAAGRPTLSPSTHEELIGADGTLRAPPEPTWAGLLQGGRFGYWRLPGETLARMGPRDMLDGHLLHAPAFAEVFAESGCRMVLILRDPRAVAVSHATFAEWWRDGREPVWERYSRLSMAERIRHSFLSSPGDDLTVSGVLPLPGRYRNMLSWNDLDSVLCVRFEDLVGAQGGGDAARQVATLRRVLDHLGFRNWSTAHVEALGEKLFGETLTFRTGRIGDWREHAEVFEEPELAEATAEILDLLAGLSAETEVEPGRGRIVRAAPARAFRWVWRWQLARRWRLSDERPGAEPRGPRRRAGGLRRRARDAEDARGLRKRAHRR